jgi:hypothetical protein
VATGDFCTVAQVQAELSRDPSSTTDQAVLGQIISAVSDWIVRVTGHDWLETDYDELYDGKGGQVLVPKQAPLSIVSLVQVNGTTIPRSAGPLVPGWVNDDVSIALRGAWRFARGLMNVRLVYTAGYTSDALPPLLVQAAIDLTVLTYKTRDRLDVHSKVIAGETVTYLQTAMPPRTKQALALLSRPAMAA